MARLSDILGSDGKKDFYARLNVLAQESAVGLQASINLQSETRISTVLWRKLVAAVLSADNNAASIRSAIKSVFRAEILQGPKARCSRSTIFGRAVTAGRLARCFVANGDFASPAAAKSHIRSMHRKPLDYICRSWSGLQLGRYVMWSTLDTSGRRPFENLDEPARRIMGLLGLDRIEESQPLILLEYRLPLEVTPKFPRIVEAYAGDDWIYYFRPAPPSEQKHGWTLPWDEVSSEKPRPEVVHNPITGATLAAPLKEVR